MLYTKGQIIKNIFGVLICIIISSCNNEPSDTHSGAIEKAKQDSLNYIQQTLAQKQADFILDSLKRRLNNTWTLYYGSSGRISSISNIVATDDNGCIFSTEADIKLNDGMQILDKRIYKLYKVDSLGNLEWSKEISDWANCLTNTKQQSYFVATSNKFQLYDNNGNLKLEKDIILDGHFNLSKAYCFNENEIILVGMREKRGIVIKLDMELNIISNHLFGKGPEKKYYSDGSYDIIGDAEHSQINSIVKGSNGKYYFTGKKKGLLWIGKTDDNLELIWEKNDFNFESNGNRALMGNTILEEDNGFVIASSYSNPNYASILLKLDSDGKLVWHKNLKGQIGDEDISLMRFNNSIYLITFDSDSENGYSSDNPLYSKLYKINLKGGVEKETKINVNGNNVLAFKVVNINENCYFVLGRNDRNGNNKNKENAGKAIISKFNSNDEIGETYYDFSEQDGGNSLTINLDFNDNQNLTKFLNIYDFHCYIKNGYSTVLSFNPNEDVNTGTVTFTMFLIKKSGGFDIVSSQEYKYSMDKNTSPERIYFKTSMQGEIYLEKDGSVIMNDNARNEHYIYNYSKR